MVDARERLIVALDSKDIDEARAMVRSLGDAVSFYKVGLVLQLAHGTEEFIRSLIAEGKKVFLDYKYYDIPETMRKTIARAARLGVSFLTIHGPGSLIRAAVEARGNLKLFTVTVLTSMDADDLAEMGYIKHSVEELVLFRARKAMEAGCDGVIASGHEARQIKALCGNLLVITPGIRPEGSAADDQKRRTTPRIAIEAGADYLVVGRPITNPATGTAREVAEAIVREMQPAFDRGQDRLSHTT